MDDIQEGFNGPVLFVSDHVFDDHGGFLNDFVLIEFNEGEFLDANHLSDDIDCVSVHFVAVEIVKLSNRSE